MWQPQAEIHSRKIASACAPLVPLTYTLPANLGCDNYERPVKADQEPLHSKKQNDS